MCIVLQDNIFRSKFSLSLVEMLILDLMNFKYSINLLEQKRREYNVKVLFELYKEESYYFYVIYYEIFNGELKFQFLLLINFDLGIVLFL